MPTASGLSRLAAVEADTLRERLEQVLAATHAYTIVHCCAPSVPFGIIRAAGADGIAFDLSQLRRGDEDGVAESAEAGMGLLTGAVPAGPDQAAASAAAGASAGGAAAAARAAEPGDGSARRGRPRSGSSGCGGGWGCRWRRARSRR